MAGASAVGAAHPHPAAVVEVAGLKVGGRVLWNYSGTKEHTLGCCTLEPLPTGHLRRNTEIIVWLFQCFIARETWGFFPEPGIDQTD